MDTRTECTLAAMMKQIYQVVDGNNPATPFTPSDLRRLNNSHAFQPGSWVSLAKEGGLTEDEIMKILGWPI